MLASFSGFHAAMIPDEQGNTKPGFEFADASAERGFLDIQGCGRPPKAAMLGCRNDITNVMNLNGHSLTPTKIRRAPPLTLGNSLIG